MRSLDLTSRIPVDGPCAALLRLAPGDPAAIIAGDYATPEAIAKIRTALGLDHPIYVQLGVYVASLARGDLGRSLHSRLPVRTLIAQRLEPTLALAVSTLVFAVGLAIPLGVLAAWRAGTWIDTIQGVTLLSSAVYVFVNLLVDLCYLVLDPRIRY